MFTKPEYKDIQDHLLGLLEDIYLTGDVDDLEFHLENVCRYFNLKIFESKPLFKTQFNPNKNDIHPHKKHFDIDSWKTWNQDYLKKIANQ